MSRDEALSGLQQVIDFIAAHPLPPPADGEVHHGVFADRRAAVRYLELIKASVRAVGLEVIEDEDRQTTLEVSDLDEDQRAVVEVLARHPELRVRLAMPSPAWAKRKWLGIDPPGPLFTGTPTLFAKMRTCTPNLESTWGPLIEALPDAERIMALTDLVHMENDFNPFYAHSRLLLALDTMPTTLAAWAERTADLLLSVQGTRWEWSECGTWGIKPIVVEAVLHAMVRGGRAIDQRYDGLLALENYASELQAPILRAIVEAIEPHRRERAIAHALARLPSTALKLTIAMNLLSTFPYAAVAEFALAHVEEGKTKKALRTIGALAKKHPAIAEVLARYTSVQPPGAGLTVLERSVPTLEELDDVARQQVELCARAYDERQESAAQLIACAGAEPIGPFERTRTAQSGQPAHDVWRYRGDSGTVFRAGTTTIVAEIVQDGIECSDRALKRSLLDVLSVKPGKKPRPAQRPAAKAAKANARPAARRTGTTKSRGR